MLLFSRYFSIIPYILRSVIITLSVIIIAGCAPSPRFRDGSAPKKKSPVKTTQTVINYRNLTPGFTWTAIASYYGTKFNGRKTANGEVYDMYGLTAAHKTIPFNTILEVKNLKNNRTVNVRVNDRGPFIAGRELDLSLGAAKKLAMVDDGVVKVRIKIVSVGVN